MRLTEIEKLIGDASNDTVPYSAAANAICAAEQQAVAKMRTLSIDVYKCNCRRYVIPCVEGKIEVESCPANCEYLADFIASLSEGINKI